MGTKIKYVIDEIRKKEAKSILNIARDIINYSSRQGLSPGEYFTYGLHKKANVTQLELRYMPNAVHFKEHLPALNNFSKDILKDKLLFKNLMQKDKIPMPKTIGYAGPGKRNDLDFDIISPKNIHEILARHNVTNFIVKPSSGTHGKGIHYVEYINEKNSHFIINKKKLEPSEFFRFLSCNCEDLNKNYVLFEYTATRNNTLKEISPDASPNIRIITMKAPNGEVHIASASMRLGRKNSVTSNASSGGLLAKIDIESGSIVSCRTSTSMDGKFVSSHPDTLCQIIGVEIPNWSSVLSICKRSASAIESMNSVGWDVLIDKTTPVIIEGNGLWCMISEQIFGQGYLTPKTKELLKLYGLDFTHKKPPKPSLSKLKLAFFGS